MCCFSSASRRWLPRVRCWRLTSKAHGSELGRYRVHLLAIGTGLSAIVVGGEGIGGYWAYRGGVDVTKLMSASEETVPIFLFGFALSSLGLISPGGGRVAKRVIAGQSAPGGRRWPDGRCARRVYPGRVGTYVLGVGIGVGLLPLANSMQRPSMTATTLST